MISRMMRRCLLSVVYAFALVTVFTLASGQCYGFEIEIDVAPNVLNLQNQAQVVTVHTDVPYGTVAAVTVYLNEIPISSWKADDRGYFVAKFLMSDVKDQVTIGPNTLVLSGTTIDGSSFSGEQTITVVNNKGKK